MTSKYYKAAAILIALAAGWWLAGDTGGANAAAQDPASTPRRPAFSPSPTAEGPAPSNRPWSGATLPLEDFHGIHEIPHGSPALNVEHLWQDGADEHLLFSQRNSFDTLVGWLDLKPTETDTLREILRRAARRQLDWEMANLKATRLEPGHHQVRWSEPPAGDSEALRQELREAFGEILARSIWIRGGLERFAEPIPGWKRRGIEEIDLHLTPAVTGKTITARITNGDFTRTWALPADAPESGLPLRLRHVFPVDHDAAELLANLPPIVQNGGIPLAEWVRPGYVKSPFGGKIIDVGGIPPGTLVMDPTMPPDAKAMFRIPAPE